MKKYSQRAVRDHASDIIIEQYVEHELPSGLIVPQHINTVAVERQISAEMMVVMSKTGLEYAPDSYQILIEPRVSKGFVIEPQDRLPFCEKSSQVIANAFKYLTYQDVPPRLLFHPVDDSSIADEDHLAMKSVAQRVHDIINEVDQLPGGDGMYL